MWKASIDASRLRKVPVSESKIGPKASTDDCLVNPKTGEIQSPGELRKIMVQKLAKQYGRPPTKKEINQAWPQWRATCSQHSEFADKH
jgi:hypothetical protein